MIKIVMVNGEFIFEGEEAKIVKKEMARYSLNVDTVIHFVVNDIEYKLLNKYIVSIIID